MSNLQGSISVKDDGVVYKPSLDELEMLKTLPQSPAWQVYRKILQNLKNGYFHQTLAMEGTNQILKNIGMVSGINLSINYIDALIKSHESHIENLKEKEQRNVNSTKPNLRSTASYPKPAPTRTGPAK